MESFLAELREESLKGFTDDERAVRSRQYFKKSALIERMVNAVVDRRDGKAADLGSQIRQASKEEKALIRAALLKRLDADDDEDVRVTCLINLGSFPGGRGELFARVLRADRSPRVRKVAAHALGNYGSEEELAALFDAANQDRAVAQSAIFSIGSIGGPRATDWLIALWNNPEASRGNRDVIVASIGAAGGPNALNVLEEVLQGKDDSIRSSATVGVWHLAQRNSKNPPVFEAAVAVLRECLQDRNPNVRESAIYGLGWVGNADDVRLLEAMLKDDYFRQIRYTEDGQVRTRNHYPVRAAAAETIERMKARLKSSKRGVLHSLQ